MKLLLLIAFFFVTSCATSAHKIGNSLPVSTDFVGRWQPEPSCKIPSGLAGELSIRPTKKPEILEVIVQAQREAQPFNADFDMEYQDFANEPFNVKGSVEVFFSGKTVSSATVWHPREAKDKSVGVILKTYELNEKGQLVFHKYGYVSHIEKDKFQVTRYGDKIANDYRCVYNKKK